MNWFVIYSTFFTIIVLNEIVSSVALNVGRETHERVTEVLEAVKRIEEQLRKEERLREITDIVRIDSSMDKMNKKLDRLIAITEQGGGSSFGSSSRALIPRDVANNLEGIDDRLRRLEDSTQKIQDGIGKSDDAFQKLDDIEKNASKLKDDLNQKLRKMMNVITALYEMNKEIKTNFGGRSEIVETKSQNENNYAAEFLIENLEELERKIKEQFSVLTTDIRSEITSLKIVAASMGDQCDPPSNTEDFETPGGETPMMPMHGRGGRRIPQKENSERNKQMDNSRSSSAMSDSLDNLVQSLGRTTREIKDEIHQGMQAIDDKLANLTQLSPQQCDPLQTSDSIAEPVRVSGEFVRVQEQNLAEKNSRSELCSRVAKNVNSPKSCAELKKGGVTCDGIYVIFPKSVRAVRVLCDMTTEGGGWTVLMQRGDFDNKMTSFHKNWLSYKNGFGDMEGEFWLGNDVMNLLTVQDDNILRVHLKAFDGDDLNLTYSSFSVANETDSYRLNIGTTIGAPSPASNSFRYHNNHSFSTFDRKNDKFEQNCAATYKGGWWFNGCYFGFLTGEYFTPNEKRENWRGILWYDWKGDASLKGAQMLIRPKNFASL